VVDQPRALGVVRFKVPAPRSALPVIVQGEPETHDVASALPAVTTTDAPIPPVSSAQAPSKRAARPLLIDIRYLITSPSPPYSVLATPVFRYYQ
jgi:hypothetical protein